MLDTTENFNQRKFVPFTLFLLFLSLVATGVFIEIAITYEIDLMKTISTASHVLFGVAFTIFSVMHTITYWRALCSYLKINRETLAAIAVVLVIALIVALMTYFGLSIGESEQYFRSRHQFEKHGG